MVGHHLPASHTAHVLPAALPARRAQFQHLNCVGESALPILHTITLLTLEEGRLDGPSPFLGAVIHSGQDPV